MSVEMHCHVCGSLIPKVMPNEEYDEQLEDALWVSFDGGYGMFFDTDFTTHPDHYRVVLCHSCAHDLCNRIEWIEKLIDPEHGHFHDHMEYPHPSELEEDES